MRVWIVAVVVVGIVAGLGFAHPFGNPRAEPAEGLGTLLRGAKMPMDAKVVLVTKCADCHSNETRWPVYARVAPGSWLIERDIVEVGLFAHFANRRIDRLLALLDQSLGEIPVPIGAQQQEFQLALDRAHDHHTG